MLHGARTLLLPLVCFACTNGQRPAPSASEGDPAGTDLLVNRVWTLSEPAERPGVIKAFLSDGTLIQDSCWETHRLSHWERESDGRLLWREDGIAIRAVIVTLTETELVLRIDLAGGNGSIEERLVPAAVPYVCPDYPR
ncbi:MAG TPA: hypothetical protein VF329_00740 [Gammaproteobacteria bacterium]